MTKPGDSRHGHHMHWGSASPERLALMRQVIDEIAGYIESKELVDLGSGDGSITKILAERCKRVYAVDNDRELLQLLSDNCKGIENIVPILSETERIALGNGTVDAVFSSSSFHDMPSGYENEMARVLRAGGFAIVFDWNESRTAYGPPSEIRLSKDAVTKKFVAAGFSIIKEKDYETHYLLVFRKSGA